MVASLIYYFTVSHFVALRITSRLGAFVCDGSLSDVLW